MKLSKRETARTILAATLVTTATAFTAPAFPTGTRVYIADPQSSFRRHGADAFPRFFSKLDDRDDEIARLRNMAAQLRAEAAALESEQRSAMALAAEHAFEKFDTNNDGEITVEELKAGLEKAFKTELPQKRVEQLMREFDASGDGALQLDEMVTVEKFRNKLDALAREEKELARAEAKRAQEEQQAYQLMQAGLERINDREPTTQEKVISVLPYLFPLLDGLQFAAPLIFNNAENPVAQIAALTYALYRSIPFGGFVAFFALNFLSGNPTINRLIRFNMQQAIFLDIALFFPALLGSLINLAGSAAGFSIPSVVSEYGSDVLFAATLVSVVYSSVSSLLGQTPNRIPFISEAVERRMPTFDIMNTQGRILTREEREEARKELQKKKENEDQKTNGDDA